MSSCIERPTVVVRRLLAIATLLLSGSALRADILFLDSFRNVGFLQTGNGNTLSSNGAFFSSDLNTSIANSYASVSMSYPGPGSPVSLPQITPNDYHYQTASFATKSAMDAAFPTGTYLFQASGPSASASFQYTADDYGLSNPYLTGTDYTSLQGMNPAQAFTLHISPFTTGSNASVSFIFLTIFDYTKGMFVFSDGFLAPTTTTVALPANTLAYGDNFSYEIDFSNRDLVASPGATNQAQLGFELRTDGNFSTAATPAPEPSTIALCGLALLTVALRRRKPAR